MATVFNTTRVYSHVLDTSVGIRNPIVRAYNVQAHLRYIPLLTASNLNNITIKEGPGDTYDISGTVDASLQEFRDEINTSLTTPTLPTQGWEDVSSGVTDVSVNNAKIVGTNNAWDHSLADAFDTVIGAAMLTGDASYNSLDAEDDLLKAIHFAEVVGAYNTVLQDGSDNLLGHQIIADISAGMNVTNGTETTGILQDILNQFQDISDSSGNDGSGNANTLGNILSGNKLRILFQLCGDSSGGNIQFEDTLPGGPESLGSTTGANKGLTSADIVDKRCVVTTPSDEFDTYTIAPCIFLLEYEFDNTRAPSST